MSPAHRPLCQDKRATWAVLWQGDLVYDQTELLLEIYVSRFARFLSGDRRAYHDNLALRNGEPLDCALPISSQGLED